MNDIQVNVDIGDNNDPDKISYPEFNANTDN
jgi:hypothetical protein